MRASPLFVLVALSGGCWLFRSASPPPVEPAVEEEQAKAEPREATPGPIQITLRASEQLNPDERGQPLPTVVMLYQLKSAAKLKAADYKDVFAKPKDALGEDLLQGEELQLAPGQTQTRTLDRDKAAKAFAVVAIVRQPKGPGWRSIVELPAPEVPAELSFVLDGYRVDPQ